MDKYTIEHPEQHTQECLDYAKQTRKNFCIASCYDGRMSSMGLCVMCGTTTHGVYKANGREILVCFEHYQDGTFADYLKEHEVDYSKDAYLALKELEDAKDNKA